MLYRFLHIIAQIALRLFFKRLNIRGKEKIPYGVPLIVAANHPNTFMDPIIIASQLRQPVYFLTNASVFSSPFVSKCLKMLHMIPIYRQKDIEAGAQGNNEEVFKKCYDFLASGGCLLIFPEGSSVHERKLRPLKTGTARIALGAEAMYDFSLDLHICCIGLNYSSPSEFQSNVFVQVSEPIKVLDFQDNYKKSSSDTVHQLTALLTEKITQLIVVAQDAESDLLISQVEQIYTSELLDKIGIDKRNATARLQVAQKIAQAIKEYRTISPEIFAQIHTKIEQYLADLEELKIHDNLLRLPKGRQHLFWDNLAAWAYLLMGFPLYFYGLVHHYLPYLLPARIAKAISKEPEYHAPIKLVSGMLIFPIWYVILVSVFSHFFTRIFDVIGYALSLPLGAFYAIHYYRFFGRAKMYWKMLSFSRNRQDVLADLQRRRNEIINQLEKIKTMIFP